MPLYPIKVVMLPILYSFRRCPYAIRARMTLHYAGIQVELREVLLKDKPASMLAVSSKGTVPVLILPDGQVMDESYDVMRWALANRDPDHWWLSDRENEINELIQFNDHEFKTHLDHYKYFDRFPEHPKEYYRAQAENFLSILEEKLTANHYLLDENMCLADIAVFPFIRQFAFVDKAWFDQAHYPNLQRWLAYFLESALFLEVMEKYPVFND